MLQISPENFYSQPSPYYAQPYFFPVSPQGYATSPTGAVPYPPSPTALAPFPSSPQGLGQHMAPAFGSMGLGYGFAEAAAPGGSDTQHALDRDG